MYVYISTLMIVLVLLGCSVPQSNDLEVGIEPEPAEKQVYRLRSSTYFPLYTLREVRRASPDLGLTASVLEKLSSPQLRKYVEIPEIFIVEDGFLETVDCKYLPTTSWFELNTEDMIVNLSPNGEYEILEMSYDGITVKETSGQFPKMYEFEVYQCMFFEVPVDEEPEGETGGKQMILEFASSGTNWKHRKSENDMKKSRFCTGVFE